MRSEPDTRGTRQEDERDGLLDLIGTIYDAVIDPSRWSDVLAAICERYGFCMAMLDMVDMSLPKDLLKVHVNIPAAYQDTMTPRHLLAVEKLWGGAARMQTLPLEEPLLYSRQTDPATWPGNAYYEEFAKPLGIVDALVLFLMREGPFIAGVGFSRHRSAGPIGRAEIDAMRILAPHLRRAVAISGLLRSASSAMASFEAALNASASGAALVDEEMRIVHANSAARRMLDEGDPISEHGDKLQVLGERHPGAVAAAVRAAAHEATMGRRGIAIPARRADGSPLVLTVMPLERRSLRTGATVHASAAIFIAASHEAGLPSDAVGELFDLTPMEARVFELVAAGRSTAASAVELGVAPSTFRTHLLHVFEKTGRRNRAGLMKLASEIRSAG